MFNKDLIYFTTLNKCWLRQHIIMCIIKVIIIRGFRFYLHCIPFHFENWAACFTTRLMKPPPLHSGVFLVHFS